MTPATRLVCTILWACCFAAVQSIQLREEQNANAKTIWVVAEARSLSTTIMQSYGAGRKFPQTFNLFEPCHAPFTLGNWSSPTECMAHVLDCDIPDTPKQGKFRAMDHAKAKQRCSAAALRIMKTIGVSNLREVVSLLDKHPELHVVVVNRDPRAIYASRLQQWVKTYSQEAVDNLCNSNVYDMGITHPRMQRIEFDEAVSDPEKVFKRSFEKIGLEFGDVNEDWVGMHFWDSDCRESSFGTCRKNPEKHINQWMTTLPIEVKEMFRQSSSCSGVIHRHGYDSASLARFGVMSRDDVTRYQHVLAENDKLEGNAGRVYELSGDEFA